MRKIHLIGFALIAVFAFNAAMATSAFAELEYLLAMFLVGGLSFTGSLAVEINGELLLENLNNGADIVCSGILDGLIKEEEPSENLSHLIVEKVLSLVTGNPEVLELSGEAILCTALKTCEAGTDVEIYPDELPWLFYIDLHVETGEIEELYVLLVGLDIEEVGGVLLEKLPGYEIKCLVIGLPVEELCSAADEAEGELLNVTEGVEGMGALSPEGVCGTTSGIGLQAAEPGNLLLSSEGVVSISSE